jgi:hypothetical protein
LKRGEGHFNITGLIESPILVTLCCIIGNTMMCRGCSSQHCGFLVKFHAIAQADKWDLILLSFNYDVFWIPCEYWDEPFEFAVFAKNLLVISSYAQIIPVFVLTIREERWSE